MNPIYYNLLLMVISIAREFHENQMELEEAMATRFASLDRSRALTLTKGSYHGSDNSVEK